MTNRSDENNAAAATGAAQKHQSEFFKDPIKVAVSIGVSLLIAAAWYITIVINPSFDRQAADLTEWSERQDTAMRELTAKMDGLSDEMGDLNEKIIRQGADSRVDTNSILTKVDSSLDQIDGLERQLSSLDNSVNRVEVELKGQIAALETSFDTGITLVEQKSESTEKKVEEKLAALPETENVVTQLDEQEDRITSNEQNVEDTERDFKLLESLVLIGIEHPVLEQTIYTLVKDNPELAESDALIKLWDSRGDYSAANFVGHLMDSYTIAENSAMLLAYPALTETKPIRFFIPLHEIEANAEPQIAAAKAADEEAAVPLAKPLSISRVCAEMSDKPTIECYKYFLNLSDDVNDDKITLDSPSDGAVMRLIVEKHAADVPGS